MVPPKGPHVGRTEQQEHLQYINKFIPAQKVLLIPNLQGANSLQWHIIILSVGPPLVPKTLNVKLSIVAKQILPAGGMIQREL